jgi:hypothetical protein
MRMKDWKAASKDSLVPGLLAGAAVSAAAAACGRREKRSALAPINAPSHVVWGDQAAAVEQHLTGRHTGLGLAVAAASTLFWAALYQKLFGAAVERRGPGTALLAGVATAGIAYVTDYHVMPRRLTPGYEKQLSNRSLFMVFGTLALSLGAGALLQRRMRH